MITRLRGRIEHIDDTTVTVDIGAFGVQVFVPASNLAQLQVGLPIVLYTHLHIREQDISLYGFETAEELDIFYLLLSIDGVGPRMALNVISTLTPDTLRLAIANEEPGLLTRVPGIGIKTARKMLFHLKDKIAPDTPGAMLSALTDADAEVIEALTSLGYSVVEAQRVIQRLPKDVAGVEDRLRAALTQLSP